jgi:hypothetical protein
MPRKLRGKLSEPPELVDRILRVVNLIPPSSELQSVEVLFNAFKNVDSEGRMALFDGDLKRLWLRGFRAPPSIERDRCDATWKVIAAHSISYYMRAALMACLADLPQAFIHYVLDPLEELKLRSAVDITEETVMEWHTSFFDNFATSPLLIDSIRFTTAVYRSRRKYNQVREWSIRLNALLDFLEGASEPDWFRVQLESNEGKYFSERPIIINGTVHFPQDACAKAFEGLKPERIKRCEHCRRVFWVKRLGTRACGPVCTSVLSTRKWRSKSTLEERRRYETNRILKASKKENKPWRYTSEGRPGG